MAVLPQAHYQSSYSSFQGFYSYLYSRGAYPVRLELLLNISWECGESLVSFTANFIPRVTNKVLQ